MGSSIPKSLPVNKHIPRTSHLMRAVVRQIILNKIDTTGLTAKEIALQYRTFRKGYVREIREGVPFGLDRYFSICESTDIWPVISFVNGPKEQARVMNDLLKTLMAANPNSLLEAA